MSSLGGSPDIWSVRPQGGFPTRLTLGLGEVEFLASRIPRWSPDGRFMSYVSNESGMDEVWLWSANGEEPQYKLTSLGGRIHSMSWSPDGQSIGVACNRYGAYDIYNVQVPSGKAARLRHGPLFEVNPVFAPDRKHVLYVRLNDTWEDHDIIVMGVDGSDPRVVVKDSDFFDYSFISHD